MSETDSGARLVGRVVVVTAAAAGIGLAALTECVAAGARVLAVDQDQQALAAIGDRFGSSILTLTADVGLPDAATRYVAAALAHFGPLDMAMLNADMAGDIAPLEQVSAEQFDRVMAVNARSVWSGLASLFPAMRASGVCIVVTASTG